MPFARRQAARIGAAAALSALPRAARAQSGFPARPPRWMVGYPPGGASDVFARLIAAQMVPRLGQNVVVENRPGGGAVLASETVARSAPDGYTWLHTDNGILAYNPALYARLPYDPDRDLTGVGFIGRFPLFIVVRRADGPEDFAAFLAAARQRPPTYGSPAVASPHHLAMELVRRRTGLEAVHVPYRGGPAAMADLMGGALDCAVIDIASGLPFIRDGRVRALAVLSATRSRHTPDVPTMRELGHGDTVAYGWMGNSVPAATPPAIIGQLSQAMMEAILSPEGAARYDQLGAEYEPRSPEEFNAFVAAEAALWRPLIRELGIRLDS